MPVLINEVVAEVEPTVVPEIQAEAREERVSSTKSEFELMQLFTVVEERRQRLMVD